MICLKKIKTINEPSFTYLLQSSPHTKKKEKKRKEKRRKEI